MSVARHWRKIEVMLLPMTSAKPVEFSTNWAMKPHRLAAGRCIGLMCSRERTNVGKNCLFVFFWSARYGRKIKVIQVISPFAGRLKPNKFTSSQLYGFIAKLVENCTGIASLQSFKFQHCRVLHVTSVFTPCCMLLRVGSCCATFETGQTFEPTTPNISFVPLSPKRSATIVEPFAQFFQHCLGPACALHMVSMETAMH